MTQINSTNTTATQTYFEGWKLYETVIRNNYMRHSEMITTLQRWLQDSDARPLRVLELGCGDAWVAFNIFGENHDLEYHGMDLSAPAMAIGKSRAETLGWKNSRWIEASFPEGLAPLHEPYDLILAGFALHHLQSEELHVALTECRRLLKPNGNLIVYDELRRTNESREAYLARMLESVDQKWLELDTEQRNSTHAHIKNYDFPISLDQWRAVVSQHDFTPPESLYLDEDELFGMFRLTVS